MRAARTPRCFRGRAAATLKPLDRQEQVLLRARQRRGDDMAGARARISLALFQHAAGAPSVTTHSHILAAQATPTGVACARQTNELAAGVFCRARRFVLVIQVPQPARISAAGLVGVAAVGRAGLLRTLQALYHT